MTRSWPVDRRRLLDVIKAVVLVGNLEDQGRPHRPAESNTRLDVDGVGLDLHAPATTVTTLAATEFRVDELDVQFKPGRQAIDDGEAAWSV